MLFVRLVGPTNRQKLLKTHCKIEISEKNACKIQCKCIKIQCANQVSGTMHVKSFGKTNISTLAHNAPLHGFFFLQCAACAGCPLYRQFVPNSIYIYIYIYARVYMFIYVYKHIYIYICIYIYIYIYVYTFICLYLFICVSVYVQSAALIRNPTIPFGANSFLKNDEKPGLVWGKASLRNHTFF